MQNSRVNARETKLFSDGHRGDEIAMLFSVGFLFKYLFENIWEIRHAPLYASPDKAAHLFRIGNGEKVDLTTIFMGIFDLFFIYEIRVGIIG